MNEDHYRCAKIHVAFGIALTCFLPEHLLSHTRLPSAAARAQVGSATDHLYILCPSHTHQLLPPKLRTLPSDCRPLSLALRVILFLFYLSVSVAAFSIVPKLHTNKNGLSLTTPSWAYTSIIPSVPFHICKMDTYPRTHQKVHGLAGNKT